MRYSEQNIANLVTFLVVVSLLFFFTGAVVSADAGGASAAGDARCGQTPGVIKVTHDRCTPPGPISNGGHDTYFCNAQDLSSGQIISGTCMAGCCQLTGYTPSSSVFSGSSAGGTTDSYIKTITTGIIVQTAMGAINSLFTSISGGGTSGSYDSGYSYTNGNSYLDYTDNGTTGTDDSSGFNLSFGTGDTTNSNNSNTNGILTYGNTNGSVNSATNDDNSGTKSNSAQDSVTTSYEATGSSGISGSLVGGSGSQSGVTVETSGNGRLSLADLEKAAEEARRREALLNEQNGYTGGIQDYRTSSVARLDANGNSLEGAYYGDQPQAEKKSWWQLFLEKLAALFGVGSATQATQ